MSSDEASIKKPKNGTHNILTHCCSKTRCIIASIMCLITSSIVILSVAGSLLFSTAASTKAHPKDVRLEGTLVTQTQSESEFSAEKKVAGDLLKSGHSSITDDFLENIGVKVLFFL